MSTNVASSRAYGAAVTENVIAALNSMGAQPQGCYGIQAPAPALALDFLTQSLDPRITFTRASGGTRVNSAGLIETLTTDQPRFDYDPVTLAPRGLLIEESRTNLLTYSQDITNGAWIKTDASSGAAITAPDGTATANKVVESIANATHTIQRSTVATVPTGVVTGTVYVKSGERQIKTVFLHDASSAAQCTLDSNYGVTGSGVWWGTSFSAVSASSVAVGNGWYRVTITATTSGTTCGIGGYLHSATSYAGDGTSGAYFWGAQIEAGAFPTSYIPTTTAAVTRAADVASMTGTNFSSWFNATEGTLVVKYDTANTSASQRCISVNDGTGPNRLIIRRENTGSNMSYLVANVDQLTGFNSMGAFPYTGGSQAFAYKVNDFAASSFGGSVYTDASGSLMTPNLMDMGRDSQGGASINGHLQRITYYNKRLPDATLKALSA